MKHYKEAGRKRAPDNSLLENVYAIIDSRIQYLEYQNERLFRQHTELESQSVNTSDSSLPLLIGSKKLINNFESLLDQITSSNHTLKLLLFLRTRLIKENARVVLELLTDNRFLDYSEDRLQQFLIARQM